MFQQKFVDLSHGKNFLQFPRLCYKKTNEFEDGLQKLRHFIVFFWTLYKFRYSLPFTENWTSMMMHNSCQFALESRSKEVMLSVSSFLCPR